MDKGVYLLLNSKCRKNIGKVTIESKAVLTQAPALSEPQSTKATSKPSFNSIPTYRFMQYVLSLLLHY